MANETQKVHLCIEQPETPLFQFAVSGIFTSFLVIFGVCGSFYSFYRIRRRARIVRLASYLLVLCCWDLSLLLCTFGFYALAVLVYGTKPWYGWCTYFYWIFYPLINMSMAGSMWMVVAITFERCFAISHPLRQRVGQQRRLRRVCFLILVLAILFNLPTAFELRVKSCFSEKLQIDMPRISLTTLRNNKMYQLFYRVFLFTVLMGPGPFVVVFVLTMQTMAFRRVALEQTNGSTPIRRNSIATERLLARDSNTVPLLTAVILKYLICYTPPTIINVFEFLDKHNYWTYTNMFRYIVDLSNLLVVVHSATNWVIFCKLRKPQRMPRTTRKVSFPAIYARQLYDSWSKLNPETVGEELLSCMIRNNPSLGKHFYENSENRLSVTSSENTPFLLNQYQALSEHRRSSLFRKISGKLSISSKPDITKAVSEHGCRVGNFLDKLILDLADLNGDTNTIETFDKMRNAGMTHYHEGVNLKNCDWVAFKDFMVRRIVDTNVGSVHADKIVTTKFVSLLIHEMKCGFVCEAVVESTAL